MLLAGNKAKGKSNKSKWKRWYTHAIPEAEKVYASNLKRLEENNVRS